MVDFCKLFAKKDAEACREQIGYLRATLPDEVMAWEEVLISLTCAVEQEFSPESMSAVLDELPFNICKAFFKRLTSSAELSPECMKTMVAFILEKEELRNDDCNELISILLLSPFPIAANDLNALIARVNPQKLGDILLELHQQSSDLIFDSQKDRSSQKINRHYQLKYEVLLTALCIHASNPDFKLSLLINDNPFLANLIIINRLRHVENESQRQKIIEDLFKQNTRYDWQDGVFKKMVLPELAKVLAKADSDKSIELFSKYIKLKHDRHPTIKDRIHLLDECYQINGSVDFINRCIQAADTDNNFLINFLTNSKLNDSKLNIKLLENIPQENLPDFVGHMLAMNHIAVQQRAYSFLFENFIFVFCQRIKKANEPFSELMALAKAAERLPEPAIEQLVKEVTQQVAGDLLLQSYWLTAALQIFPNKKSLLPYCCAFLCNFWKKSELLLPLLQNLSSEDLVMLYTLMVQEKAPAPSYDIFKTLFSESDRHPQLFYLLLNTPAIHQELLNDLIQKLDDKNLLTLIDELLNKSEENSEFKNTLHQVLLLFCRRLPLSKDKKENIHQWTEQPFTPILAQNILEDPDCVYELSLTDSTLWSWVSWTSISAALALRIDRILNATLLSSTDIKKVAFIWLSHFRQSPDKLILIFNHLEQTGGNRDEIGRVNYASLKKSCWNLLKKDNKYTDEYFKVFIKQLKQPQTFDPILCRLATQDSLQDNPAQGARLLALTQSPLPSDISNEALLPLLIHSVHEETLGNWQKAKQLLDERSVSENVLFIRQLLNAVEKAHFNPILVSKAYDLILNSRYFETVFVQLSEHHWHWFFRHTPLELLNSSFPYWFDLLIQYPHKESLNIGRLLILLPEKDGLIEQILSKEFFQSPEGMASLFAELAEENDGIWLFVHLHQNISRFDLQWRKQFIKQTLNLIHSRAVNPPAVHVLNVFLLMMVEQLSPRRSEDSKLMLKQLQLFGSLIDHAEEASQQDECRRLMLNLLTRFCYQDVHWAKQLLPTDSFTNLMTGWLKNLNFERLPHLLHQHPLTQLLMDNITGPFQAELRSNVDFQQFIMQLLISPPASMNIDQFLMLSEHLPHEQKIVLAKKICLDAHYYPVQVVALPILANYLTVKEFYLLYHEKKEDPLILKTLLSHKNGLTGLNKTEKAELITAITSGEQLLRILNGNSPPEIRIALVEEIFAYCNYDEKKLSELLFRWSVNHLSLAALANFTVKQENKRILNRIISQKTYYREFIENYLSRPALDMALTPGSYLYDFLAEAIIHPERGHLCSTAFLTQLPSELIREALTQQFQLSRNWQNLARLLKPFENSENVVIKSLVAARWHHQLLLYNALLDVLIYYSEAEPSVQEQIKESRLYQEVRFPLTFDIDLSNQLLLWLEDYIERLQPVAPEHCQAIRQILERYQQKLDIIGNYTSSYLYHCFEPCSPKRRIQVKENQQLLLNAYSYYFDEESTSKSESMEHQFHQILYTALTDRHLSKDVTFYQFLFDQILISPLSAKIEERYLKAYLQSLSPEKAYKAIRLFQQKQLFFQTALQVMSFLRNQKSMKDVLTHLSGFDAGKLQKLSEVARALNLIFLSDVLQLAVDVKKISNSSQFEPEKLLPIVMDNGLNIEWLLADVERFDACEEFLAYRCKQLSRLAFSYARDEKNRQRLSCLLQGFPQCFTKELVTNCLNSYRALFTRKGNKTEFLNLISQFLLKEGSETKYIIHHLHSDLVEYILAEALKNPENHQTLLQLFINSNYKTLCQQQLQKQLETLCYQNNIETMTSLRQMNTVIFSKLSSHTSKQIIAILRLLLMSHPEEDAEILMNTEFASESILEKQAFIADVSVFHQLARLKKEHSASTDENNLDIALHWLKSQCSEAPISYRLTMNMLSLDMFLLKKPGQYPLIQYYWLTWSAELDDSPQLLINGFMAWLSQITEFSSEHTQELQRLLQYISDQGLMKPLCEGVEQMGEFNLQQLHWFCQSLTCIEGFNSEYISHLVKIALQSGPWSVMFANKDDSYAFIRQALNKPECIQQLASSEDARIDFLQRLAKEAFPFQTILQLLQESEDKKLRSLLIIHLLGRDDYLKALAEPSFIKKLSTEKRQKPRLQALLQQIDPHQLTPAIISQLSPEATVGLLCSVRYFHVWNKTQLNALIERYPEPAVIDYWLAHFTHMPNAMQILSYITEIAHTYFFSYLNKLDTHLKKELITRLIHHADLFATSINKESFLRHCDETHLRHAIQLYINGQNSPVLKNFIHSMYHRFKKNKSSFSNEIIPWLLTLSADKDFADLKKETAHLMNQYLRLAAQVSESRLFYDEHFFNLSRANIFISLQAEKSKEKINRLLAESFEVLWEKQEKNKADKKIANENELIEEMKRKEMPLKVIDYYLVHFQGKGSVLSKLLDDYLMCYEYENMDLRPLYSTSWLMNEDNVSQKVRKTIFSAFLAHPALHDDEVFLNLLKVDAKETVKHYGQRKQYECLIQKCTYALKEALPFETGRIINKAKQEAEFEWKLSKMKGYFKGLRCWFKRCHFYGWHGFFTPKRPQYVIPFDEEGKQAIHKFPPAHRNPLFSAEEKLKAALASEFYLNIHEALMHYNMSVIDRTNEMDLRKQVDQCFESLLRQRINDRKLGQWLDENQSVFLDNRKRLLEQLLETNDIEEIVQYLRRFAEGPGQFANLLSEFEVKELPELALELKGSVKKTDDFVTTAKNVLSTVAGNAVRLFSRVTESKTNDTSLSNTSVPRWD